MDANDDRSRRSDEYDWDIPAKQEPRTVVGANTQRRGADDLHGQGFETAVWDGDIGE